MLAAYPVCGFCGAEMDAEACQAARLFRYRRLSGISRMRRRSTSMAAVSTFRPDSQREIVLPPSRSKRASWAWVRWCLSLIEVQKGSGPRAQMEESLRLSALFRRELQVA